MKTLIIDNYDSFTYNLYQLIAQVSGKLPQVVKNDEVTWDELCNLEFDNVVISPGPGTPSNPADFGICGRAIRELNKPILGVCLGHQGICHEYGGKVVHAPEPRHGRKSPVYHNGSDIFKNIPDGFNVVRYHSLMVENLPEEIQKTAWAKDGIIMGVSHVSKPIYGVQFHPESIATEHGKTIIQNFNDLSEKYLKDNKIEPTKDYISSNFKNYSNKEKAKTGFQIKYKLLNKFYDPEKVFSKLYKNKEYSVWLDSNKIIEGLSRFSYMGSAGEYGSYSSKYYSYKKQVVVNKNGKEEVHNESIFDFLNKEIEKHKTPSNELPFDFSCGFVGYFGYELKTELFDITSHKSDTPDASFLFLDRFIAVDHVEKKYYLVCLAKGDKFDVAEEWFDYIQKELEGVDGIKLNSETLYKTQRNTYLSRDEKTYISDINKCMKYITDGESYEVCLTNKMNCDCSIDSFEYYSKLRKQNPAPYSAFLKFGKDLSVACSSMERFLKINEERIVETKPIKGTLPRGKDKQEDEKFINMLENDEKFYSENLMIVDLLRNDLGIVCDIGSVCVPKLMKVETYETVHQLVSTVKGHLREDISVSDCVKATFPGGSMTGAPKKRTMEIINTLETEARGIYSGSIGFLSLNGSTDLNIVIRTAVIQPNKVSIGTGGAIIIMSDAQEEYDEILLKSRALVKVLESTKELD